MQQNVAGDFVGTYQHRFSMEIKRMKNNKNSEK